jgi:D-alanine-D-alanine ligase
MKYNGLVNRKLIVTFGGSKSEREGLYYSAYNILKKCKKNGLNCTLFDIQESFEKGQIHHNFDKHSIYYILDPYYYIHDKRNDIRLLFEVQNINYTGPKISSSMITADKNICKEMNDSFFIKNINGRKCFNINDMLSFFEISNKEHFIIKPNDKGGGEDVFFIKKSQLDEERVTMLFNRHKIILVEEYIKGTEISLALLKYRDKFIDFPIVGIVLHDSIVFDSQVKKSLSFSQIIPYQINKEDEEELRSFSHDFYRKINFRGILRIDFIINEDYYFLEANGFPNLDEKNGITLVSAKNIGLDIMDLISMQIEECLL